MTSLIAVMKNKPLALVYLMANPAILIIGLRETHDTSLPDARTSDNSSRSGDKKKN